MDQFFNTFLNWEYIWQVFPDLLKTGLLNTLILAVTSALIGTVLGMVLAVMGLSTKTWLRWPARVYTDIFRGLPAILTILGIGQDLAANTGNLSPLVAAGFVYLVITVPLTHLVNYIDKKLRTGRKVRVDDPGDEPVELGPGGRVVSL